MAQYNYLKNNFTAGQVSPRLDFRSDLVRHKNGVRTLENFVIMPHGGIRSRPGTKFVTEVKDSSKAVRLVDFQASTSAVYIIEMGDEYFRFIKDRAQIESGGSPYEVAHPYDETEVFEVRYVQSADVMYMVHPNYPVRRLNRFADTNWTVTTPTFTDGPYGPIQIGGTTLTNSATSGSITITASAPTFAATDTTGTNGTGLSDRLLRIQEGSNWRTLKITGYTSSTVVTAEIVPDETGTTTNFSGTGANDTWRLGAWSSTTGYPSTVAFYENRLVFGGNDTYPDTIWFSGIDDYENFTPDVEADDAVDFIAASEKVNRIRWLSPNKSLRMGTTGSEFEISGGSDTLSISPTNFRVTRATNYGANTVDPILVENATLFWQRSGKVLREYTYSFEQDNYVAVDLTLISEDIARGKAKQMAYQLEPDNVVWVVTETGEFIGLTYMRSQDVVGWHKHIMGGTDALVKSVAVIPQTEEDEVYVLVSRTIDGSTAQYIEYMDETFVDKTNKDAYFVDSGVHFRGTTPAATLTLSAITGNGITVTAGSSVFASGDVGKSIRVGNGRAKITAYTSGTEVTADVLRDFTSTSAASGAWTLSTDTITGLDHLEGETVTILADGGTHPTRVVSSGQVTLDGQYTDVAVGLGYTQKMETLPIDYSSNTGTQLGSRSRVTEVTISFYESVGGKFGYNADNTRPILNAIAEMDEGVPLQTKEIIRRPDHGFRDEATMAVTQDQPLPMTLLGLVMKIETSNAR